jgi:predicted AlkP superfamily pyrophosphatase or phosphodiesterase
MRKTVVIDVVGLSASLIGEHTPRLTAWLAEPSSCGDTAVVVPISPVLPAVTTTVQSTYLTGVLPDTHGIVGNGWYSREDGEVRFWKQSNALVLAPKIWDVAREQDASFTVANLFWWYNMYSSADFTVTPRPMYPSDGRKIPDVYTKPPQLRDELQAKLGQFPLFKFWGPTTSIASSEWIAESAKHVEDTSSPTLTLIYLPHLDYCLQKVGPTQERIASDLAEIDRVVGDLIDYYELLDARIILLSEYGITQVSNPVHINRALRAAGMITVRNELGRELLDCGACKAFAVADHQIAHVYVNDPKSYGLVLDVLKNLDGIDLVLEADGKRDHHIEHDRSGDIVCVARPDSWFTYYFWEDDEVAPDYARCVAIHAKPGYDPVEMFIDPMISFPMLKAGVRLLQKNLGFRYLMDLIPLDATLVQGSHGHLTKDPNAGALLITKCPDLIDGKTSLLATDIFNIILKHLDLTELPS